jgi:hypothetical protein
VLPSEGIDGFSSAAVRRISWSDARLRHLYFHRAYHRPQGTIALLWSTYLHPSIDRSKEPMHSQSSPPRWSSPELFRWPFGHIAATNQFPIVSRFELRHSCIRGTPRALSSPFTDSPTTSQRPISHFDWIMPMWQPTWHVTWYVHFASLFYIIICCYSLIYFIFRYDTYVVFSFFAWLMIIGELTAGVRILLELCPRGNIKDVIIIILVHDNVYIPC